MKTWLGMREAKYTVLKRILENHGKLIFTFKPMLSAIFRWSSWSDKIEFTAKHFLILQQYCTSWISTCKTVPQPQDQWHPGLAALTLNLSEHKLKSSPRKGFFPAFKTSRTHVYKTQKNLLPNEDECQYKSTSTLALLRLVTGRSFIQARMANASPKTESIYHYLQLAKAK